jgi:hypothetical protein
VPYVGAPSAISVHVGMPSVCTVSVVNVVDMLAPWL